ncbi:MAG: PorT family protein [Bacteroidaceae bacterium]|nr:PorT family protein [Bacteroidaceae bacterium]
MRIIIAIILFLSLPITSTAQKVEEENTEQKIKVNYGFKVGFHAATYNSTEFGIYGYKFDERIIQSNKIGYSVAPFIRLSKNKFYLQTEVTASISRHYFEFDEETALLSSSNSDLSPKYKLTTYCMQIPLLIGYNFVQQSLYGMSFFTGPKAKFVFTAHDKQEFSHFSYDNLYEELRPIVYYWELGFGVNIANFFFDFVYDIGISNNVNGIYHAESGERFHSNRSDNLLSFSVGIIF